MVEILDKMDSAWYIGHFDIMLLLIWRMGMLNEEVKWSWDFAPDLTNQGVQLQASFCSKENAASSATELEFAFCHICEEYHTRPHFYVWFDKFVFNSISLQLSVGLGRQDLSNAYTSAMWRRKKTMVLAWLSCSWLIDISIGKMMRLVMNVLEW